MTRSITCSSSPNAFVRCAALAFAAWLPALVQAQALASALVSTQATPGCVGAEGVPSGTSTSLVSIAVAAGGNCTGFASGFAYLGVVGATARTSYTGFGSNGVVIADAGAGWSDGLEFVWDNRFTLSNLGTLRLHYNIGATGGLSMSRQDRADGVGVKFGQASIGYSLNVGPTIAAGSMRQSAGGPVETTGQWGTISGSIEIMPIAGTGNDYRFTAIGLSLSGSAAARTIHLAHTEDGTAQTNAEFGSTLQWKGVVGAQAFDTQGQSLALPAGFELALVGRQTGFDYWNEAPKVAVPEPAAWAMMAAGLALLGWRRAKAAPLA